MTKQPSSRLFRKHPVLEDRKFREDLKTLVTKSGQLGSLEEILSDALRQGRKGEDVDIEAAPRIEGWTSEEQDGAVRASSLLVYGMMEYGSSDTPDTWLLDLVHAGVIEETDREPMTTVLNQLRDTLNRIEAREDAEYGVLPTFDSIEFTTELRLVRWPAEPGWRTEGVCSIALHLDDETDSTVYFQVNQRQLAELSDALRGAQEQLAAAQAYVKDGQE